MMMTADLYQTLHHAWDMLCAAHDVTADLPTMSVLFEGANVGTPAQAAQRVLVNILSEVIEGVGRFSPWYRRPPCDFGIIQQRQGGSRRPVWILTPEACIRYADLLALLAAAIDHNVGVILATQFVNDLEQERDSTGACRTASCRCTPPRTILINEAVIADAAIICDACREPFELVGRAR